MYKLNTQRKYKINWYGSPVLLEYHGPFRKFDMEYEKKLRESEKRHLEEQLLKAQIGRTI